MNTINKLQLKEHGLIFKHLLKKVPENYERWNKEPST
jgi:flavorubredoxin